MKTYLVKFRERNAGQAALRQRGLSVAISYSMLADLVAVSLTHEQAQTLADDPNVVYVERDLIALAASHETARHLNQIQAAHVQLKGMPRGANVRVALLDTGIATNRPELCVAGGVSFVDDQQSHDDDNGHGTHLAGIIGLQETERGFVGVAPDVRLYAVKVLNSHGVGPVSRVLQAIEWAIEQEMDIVSMSFGLHEPSQALEEAVQLAEAHGILLLAAAGNDGEKRSLQYPARYASVLAVGAVDHAGRIAPFSNQGDELDLLAPGVGIRSLHPSGAFVRKSGTSEATAFAAGVAALLKSNDPGISCEELRRLLVESAVPVGEGEGRLVNAYRALDLAKRGGLLGAPTVGRSEATPIELGDSISGRLSKQGDSHLHTFLAKRSEAVAFALHVPEGHDYDVFAYNSKGHLVGASTYGEGETEHLLLNVTEGESYTLDVCGFGGDTSEEPYVLDASVFFVEEDDRDNTMEKANDIQCGVHYSATLHAEDDVDWYKIAVQAGDALEVELRNIPSGTCYEVAVHDAEGLVLSHSVQMDEQLKVSTVVAHEAGNLFIKIHSLLGADIHHPYTLHVDAYKGLSGTITGKRTLTAGEGPYLIGRDGVTIAPGGELIAEPGALVNLRGRNSILVQEGGALRLVGSVTEPVLLIGACNDGSDELCREISRAGQGAVVEMQHVTVQYDHDAPEIVHANWDAPLPSVRPALVKKWYSEASPYFFTVVDGLEKTGKWYSPFAMHKRDFYLGMDVEQFTQWEFDSSRISDEAYQADIISYWEFVNAGFTADIQAAAVLGDAGQTSPNYRIQRLIDYRQTGKQWRAEHGCLKLAQIYKLLDVKESSELFQHVHEMTVLFWWSHNTSIVYWDQEARGNGIYDRETRCECMFINGVIIRLNFTADMPFHVPLIGNQFPPIGLMGILMHHSPFRYPNEYPIPAPEATIDEFHFDSTLDLIQTYLRFLLEHGTSPVFVWFLPTPADSSPGEVLREKGLTWDSSKEDWKREFLQPAWKTLHEIQVKYLQETPALGIPDLEVRLETHYA